MPKICTNILPKLPQTKKHPSTSEKNEAPYFFLEFPTTRTLGTDPHIPLFKGTLRVVTHGSLLVDGNSIPFWGHIQVRFFDFSLAEKMGFQRIQRQNDLSPALKKWMILKGISLKHNFDKKKVFDSCCFIHRCFEASWCFFFEKNI